MNVTELNLKLQGNQEYVQCILENLGFQNIKYHHRYFQFPRLEGSNPHACVLYVDTLCYEQYTDKPVKGNIYTLVMDVRGCTFPQSLDYICKLFHWKTKYKKIRLPFSGFFKRISPDEYESDDMLQTYPEEIINGKSGVSFKFFQDGIAYDIQEKWQIYYDHEKDAVMIPIRNSIGELVGIKARNNDPNCDDLHRYWSEVSYSKNSVVYGLFQNYAEIIKKSIIIIVEAEKGVLQAASFGCYICVAIGGHCISKVQRDLILSTMCEQIIIAFDEGIDEETLKEEAAKLAISNQIYCPKVGYVYDDTNEILKKGSKSSPTDCGKELFTKLIKRRKVYNEKTDRRVQTA